MFALTLLGCSAFAASQGAAPKSLEAVRTTEAIQVDGKLDEPIWAKAPVATGFTQEWPQRGQPARQRTEVRVLYDDRYVYVGAIMHHDPAVDGGASAVVRRLHRRDQDSQSDWFGVAIDSLHDRRTAFLFEVNAAGVQKDQVIFADTGFDSSWDGVWESAVAAQPDGWSVELKIPLSLLRIKGNGGPQVWGINFNRSDQGKVREFTRWSEPPRGEDAFVSRFPLLTGLEGLKPQRRTEFIPFISTARKFETANSFDDRKWDTKAGLDAHLGITPHSQVDLAVKPDFGQVEVDQAVLNLSTVETFFPEKRAFFLEGSEIFRTVGPTLFYSRRIGTAVSDPVLGPGESLVDRPLATEITAAAKYTAKYTSGLDVGVLAARVDSAEATVRDADGNLVKRELAPLTSFGVMRAQQPLDDRGSYMGGFLSYAHQAGLTGREAVVSAVDGVVKSEDRSNTLDYALIHSEAGEKGGTVPGWFGRISESRQWGGGWSAVLQAINVGHDFNINDLGYRARADERLGVASITRTWDRTAGIFRNWEWGADYGVNQDQRGHTFNNWLGARARTDFTSFWSVWGSGGMNFPVEDDRELRTYDDPIKKYLRRPRIPFLNLGFDTPGNTPWYVRVNAQRSWYEGGPSTEVDLFQMIKPTSALDLQLEIDHTRNEGERRWLETQGTTPIVGLRRLQQFNQILRAAYAFSPQFTLQMFSQWLEVNWDFRDLQAYVNDQTLQPATTQNPSAFSYRIWNLNLISRWEFRPGSAIYFVYTHGVSTDQLLNDHSSISPGLDLALLRHLPSDDVIQVKISWLFR